MVGIPFNNPWASPQALACLAEVALSGRLAGDGAFTRRCETWLAEDGGSNRVLLTPSCTAALELAVMLADIQAGDEVIMPSFTFPSAANAVVLRGGVPVFVDIRPDTLNIDENLIEAAITPRTRAIMPMHYAGVACEMDSIMALAQRHGLLVIEDAAQGVACAYKGRRLGTIGHLGAYSFHETKTVQAGEGGALLVNDPCFAARAEVMREKGTNRSQFQRGQVDKYSWVDKGSSYLLSELVAAFLYGQLQDVDQIVAARMAIWAAYHESLAALAGRGLLQRPVIPPGVSHNAHIYFIVLKSPAIKAALQAALLADGIVSYSHYVPLHISPAGQRFGRVAGDLRHTDRVGDCLLRLPLWAGMGEDKVRTVIAGVERFFGRG